MAYFQKKHKNSNSTFSNQIDQSSISNCGEQSLGINSNIFNKLPNTHQNQNQKNSNSYYQAAHSKDTSPISYLKNFKKTYCKANQQNIQFLDPKPHKTQSSNKKQFDVVINDLIRGGKNVQKNSSASQKFTNLNLLQRQVNKAFNDKQTKQSYNHQNSLTNNLFLNDHDDHSMQQMLNSSINQFQRILQQERQQDSSSKNNLYQQNMYLKKTLTRFKSILKQKLQNGLNKQKQEMKNMLNQYVQLITKLLHDKEQLSSHIQQLQNEISTKNKEISKLQKKNEQINKEKDDHIEKTKSQINEFLTIIEQFQNQEKQQRQRYQQMDQQLQRLREIEAKYKQLESKPSNYNKRSSSQNEQQQKRIQTQGQKIQTLLELLQKSQQQTNTLKQILSKQNIQIISMRNQLSHHQKSQNSRSNQSSSQSGLYSQRQVDEMKAFYQHKLVQMELEQEQQFIQYEKAIHQTISKKDQCIQRLNCIINELKQSKKSDNKQRSTSKVRQYKNQSPKFIEKIRDRHWDGAGSQNTFNEEQIGEQNSIPY